MVHFDCVATTTIVNFACYTSSRISLWLLQPIINYVNLQSLCPPTDSSQPGGLLLLCLVLIGKIGIIPGTWYIFTHVPRMHQDTSVFFFLPSHLLFFYKIMKYVSCELD